MWRTGLPELTETITDIHERIVGRLAPAEGVTWLDLACGTGAVAGRAAPAGADVTGVDLAPALIETAKERASAGGLDIDYRVGDCENLEFEDGAFDVVSSTCGVMFAPDHEASARGVARVVKPGGRIGLANWTPAEKGLAAIFRIMRPFSRLRRRRAPAIRSTGATSSTSRTFSAMPSTSSWSRASRRFAFRTARRTGRFVSSYGPTRTLSESLDDERREELHRSWVDFADTELADNGEIEHAREWVLVDGTRR